MDTKKLAREYGAMSARERFALSIAATARGDSVELVRLQAAARPITQTATDQFGYVTAFFDLARGHWAKRLNVAALLFRILHLADTAGPDQATAKGAARLNAFLLMEHAEAWRLFCNKAGLNPECDVGAGEWTDTVLKAQEEAADMGVSRAEAYAVADRMKACGEVPAEEALITRETIAEGLQEEYAELLALWGAR